MLNLFVSENLVLRTFKEEDAAELFELVHHNRDFLRSWLLWIDATQKEEHALEYIRRARQGQADQHSIAFGIFENYRLVGVMDMHHWEHRLRKAQMGYWLAKDKEGKGIVTSCAHILISYLFENLNLNKIELHFQPANRKSAAVAKRLGFTIEGILREHTLVNGSFQDIVVAGLLHREWMNR